ncbi:hypothetical protein Tco_0817400 [Tanacetum coccineum]
MSAASEGSEDQLSAQHQLMIKGLADSTASASNLIDIQVRDIVKEVEDQLKTYSPAEMDIRWYEQENVVTEEVYMADDEHDNAEFVDSGIRSIGDVHLEALNASTDDSIYDTESEIKIVKRFKPTINDEEPLVTKVTEEHPIMEEESDLESMPGDEIGSVSTSDTYGSEEDDTHSQHVELSKSEERDADKLLEELADMNASADKPSLYVQLDNLNKEVRQLTTKVQCLESSFLQQMTNKLEEIVPSLVAESLKKNLPELISKSLKNAIPQITAEFVKEIIKPINRQFNAFNKLEAARFVKLHTGLKQDLKKKV